MKKLILAVCMGLMVASCGTTGGLSPIPPVGEQTLLDEKALIGLEAAAITANEVAIAWVQSHAIEAGSPQAIEIADKLVLVRQGVLAARAAQRAGEATTMSAQIFETLALIGQIKAIIN